MDIKIVFHEQCHRKRRGRKRTGSDQIQHREYKVYVDIMWQQGQFDFKCKNPRVSIVITEYEKEYKRSSWMTRCQGLNGVSFKYEGFKIN